MKPITPDMEELYVDRKGYRCPHCGSHGVCTSGPPENGDDGITQDVGCDECGEVWTDCYSLTGIMEVEVANEAQ